MCKFPRSSESPLLKIDFQSYGLQTISVEANSVNVILDVLLKDFVVILVAQEQLRIVRWNPNL